MLKGMSKKKYTPEFKKLVVETMRDEKLSYRETSIRFDINNITTIQRWERIYLEDGLKGLEVERCDRACAASGTRKGRKPKLDKNVEEDLIAEVQRLRAENDYLKNLYALVLEDERRQNKKRW